jgi:predicted membrane protein
MEALRVNRDEEIKPGVSNTTSAIVKMIPGEAVGFYLLISGFVTKDWLLFTWVIILSVALILFRIWATSDKKHISKTFQGYPVFISVLAFLVWVYSVGNPFEFIGVPYESQIGGSLMVIISLVFPWVYLQYRRKKKEE